MAYAGAKFLVYGNPLHGQGVLHRLLPYLIPVLDTASHGKLAPRRGVVHSSCTHASTMYTGSMIECIRGCSAGAVSDCTAPAHKESSKSQGRANSSVCDRAEHHMLTPAPLQPRCPSSSQQRQRPPQRAAHRSQRGPRPQVGRQHPHQRRHDREYYHLAPLQPPVRAPAPAAASGGAVYETTATTALLVWPLPPSAPQLRPTPSHSSGQQQAHGHQPQATPQHAPLQPPASPAPRRRQCGTRSRCTTRIIGLQSREQARHCARDWCCEPC